MKQSRTSPEFEARYGHAVPIQRSIRFMHQHLGEAIKLDLLASIACMSPYHFVRVFRTVTGIPPARFLGALRLQAAKQALVKTRKSVLEICQDVGYSSLGTFTSRFTQLVGTGPAHYRELYHLLLAGDCRDNQLKTEAAVQVGSAVIRGSIDHAFEDEPIVFVGAFPSPIPQDLPLSCQMLTGAGSFSLEVPQLGRVFHILAVALRRAQRFDDLFDNGTLIVGVASSGPIVIDAAKTLSPRLTLRLMNLFDPPVLFAFPLLVHLRAGTRDPGTHSTPPLHTTLDEAWIAQKRAQPFNADPA